MSWVEPPRFDGAGYATLGRSLAEGQGYRVITEPDAPPHAHFPPAYPAALAGVWALAGTGDPARFTILAHAFSVACMAVGIAAVGRWWARIEPREVAACLTLALAVNWTWVRTGGMIRSEPLAIALGGLILALAPRSPRQDRSSAKSFALSCLLGVSILTRQVTICWAVAAAINLGWRRRWREVIHLLGGVAIVILPWVSWQFWVGSGSQSGLFRLDALPALVPSQILFYARRLPDAIWGPVVEVATVFGRSTALAYLATLGAIAVAAIIGLGWLRAASRDRLRLGGLIPLATLGLLIVWPFTEAGRFLVPLVPFILMGAVEGGAVVLGRVGVAHPRSWAGRLVLVASIPYAGYAAVTNRAAAERSLQGDFDAACAWIAAQPRPPGPVMARHAGDVAWLSHRQAIGIPLGGSEAILATIHRYRVAFLLIDDARYARSPENPLHAVVTSSRFATKVWSQGAIEIYQVD